MKQKMNVKKYDAKQITVNGRGLLTDVQKLSIFNGILTFCSSSGYDNLSWLDCYKDYEWRLTNVKDLEQGDVCFCCINDFPNRIFVFDEIYVRE